MSAYRDLPSRTSVRTVPCPVCGARDNANCLGKRGKVRESNHKERVEAYLRGKR